MAEDAANTHDLAPAGRRGRGIWTTILVWTPLLLALGTTLHTIALFLPWEHLAEFNGTVQGQREFVDEYVSSTVSNPTSVYIGLIVSVTFGQLPAAATASALWHAVIPLAGVFLLMAYFTFRWPVARWLTLALYALWLVLLSAIAIRFVQELSDIQDGSLQRLSGWLGNLLNTGIISPGDEPARPAWGFWVLAAALVISWLAWAFALIAQWRGRVARSEAESAPQQDSPTVESSPSRARLLGPILMTVGLLVWGLGLFALPQLTADCSHLVPLNPPVNVTSCETNRYYPLGVVAVSVFAENPNVLGSDYQERLLYAYFIYVRNFILLALALVATPFALVTAWRASASRVVTRSRALCLTAWWLLLATTTFVAIRAALLLVHPDRGSGAINPLFPLNIGPTPFVMGLGIIVVGISLASIWRRAVIRPQHGVAAGA